jgi:TetR/AcrR family transcriptional regulator, transcriptional repressor for nem operon
MARHKEFDKEAVLQKAMLLFWRQGYEATSVRDLIKATGISTSSLYESFGDKRAIYIAALRLYCQGEQANFQSLIKEHENIKTVLFHAFHNAHEQIHGSSQGFFSMNSIIEFGNRDPEITELLWSHYQAIWSCLRDSIAQAQNKGQVKNPQNAADIAHVLLTAIYGHASVLRVKPDFAASEGMLHSLQSLLD